MHPLTFDRMTWQGVIGEQDIDILIVSNDPCIDRRMRSLNLQ